jgi:hypothetical protein
LNSRNRFGAVGNFFLQPVHLGQRLVALGGNTRSLDRIVAVDEVGVQRVDLDLERVGV